MILENLKELRMQRKITVKDMAKRLMVSRYTIARLERNDQNVAVGTFLDYIEALGNVELRILLKQ